MRDKLIGLIIDGFRNCTKPHEVYAQLDLEALADYLIAHGVTVQKWIPVSERLPEDSGSTLVRDDFYVWDEKVTVTSLERYVKEEKAWYRDDVKLTNVTHWMPLPTAPKEVE